MRRPILILVTALLSVHCGEPQNPALCVSTSGDFATLAACKQTTPSQNFSVQSGEALYVAHHLPDGVDPGDQTVSVSVSTACTTITRTLPYSTGIAYSAFAAPPGAECSLTVTSAIENSTIRWVSAVDPVACANAGACPADAGSPYDSPDADSDDASP
jgi:hypothetical protein